MLAAERLRTTAMKHSLEFESAANNTGFVILLCNKSIFIIKTQECSSILKYWVCFIVH